MGDIIINSNSVLTDCSAENEEQELTPSILNDLVKRVYVHTPETIDGKRTQQIDIYYDLVGFLLLSLLNKDNETV